MNDYQHYNFRLEVDEPERIDKLISNYLLEYSRSTIQKWIKSWNKLWDKYCWSNKTRKRTWSRKNNCYYSL